MEIIPPKVIGRFFDIAPTGTIIWESGSGQRWRATRQEYPAPRREKGEAGANTSPHLVQARPNFGRAFVFVADSKKVVLSPSRVLSVFAVQLLDVGSGCCHFRQPGTRHPGAFAVSFSSCSAGGLVGLLSVGRTWFARWAVLREKGAVTLEKGPDSQSGQCLQKLMLPPGAIDVRTDVISMQDRRINGVKPPPNHCKQPLQAFKTAVYLWSCAII